MDKRTLTPEQIAAEEAAGMPLDWDLVAKYNVPMQEDNTQTIINLLRNSDRPQSHAKLMDDAAAALADCKYAAMLWEAFEEFQVDNDLIELTNQSVISHTEGNADLDRYVVSGAWDVIFDLFLEEVRKRLLKWPGTKDSSNG